MEGSNNKLLKTVILKENSEHRIDCYSLTVCNPCEKRCSVN